jgi:putative oxidoreductase
MFRRFAANHWPGIAALSLLILISMTVAYLTADFEAVSSIFSDPDKFVNADPFRFWLAALIVLLFGPGVFSVDAILKRRFLTFRKESITTGCASWPWL